MKKAVSGLGSIVHASGAGAVYHATFDVWVVDRWYQRTAKLRGHCFLLVSACLVHWTCAFLETGVSHAICGVLLVPL